MASVSNRSPECLRGQFYDHRSDTFSFGIILCELIARVDADPDFLPRTENFGVDYIAFSGIVNEECPPEFLQVAYNCVKVRNHSVEKRKILFHQFVSSNQLFSTILS